MGDSPLSARSSGEHYMNFPSSHTIDVYSAKGSDSIIHGLPYVSDLDGLSNGQSATPVTPFSAQLDAIDGPSHRDVQSYSENGHSSPTSRLNMGTLANTLPDHGVTSHQSHNQYGASTGKRGLQNQTFSNLHYPQPQQQMYHSRQPLFTSGTPHNIPAGQPSYNLPYPAYGAYQQFIPQPPMPSYTYDIASHPAHYTGPQIRHGPYAQFGMPSYPGSDHQQFLPIQSMSGDFMSASNEAGFTHRHPIFGPTPAYPRGPPRKPKQSGYALWVGNLPPGTNVTNLKDHFSREATDDIESLFLISKSNCAFVNYRSEAACASAMTRFHDSRFNGVRLVCRLRRGTASVAAPSSSSPQHDEAPESPVKADDSPNTPSERKRPEVVIASGSNLDVLTAESADGARDSTDAVTRTPEKYFVVKSLTLQDLEASVQIGIWATQSHNEAVLNKAFESTDNVYLVFSANKSGEYFGYARMASPIAGEAVPINYKSQQPEVEETTVDDPKCIPTPSTEWAPRGRIIDDSARGTIFWEADLTGQWDEPGQDDSSKQQTRTEDTKQGQDWGKPFKIDWISTNRLPFYRTRGLRNPWNANREVKIARDGTELEPSVGKRLVHMFHRPQVATTSQGIELMHPQFQLY